MSIGKEVYPNKNRRKEKTELRGEQALRRNHMKYQQYPRKSLPKISPGEFSKTAAMHRGCSLCGPPLYLFRVQPATRSFYFPNFSGEKRKSQVSHTRKHLAPSFIGTIYLGSRRRFNFLFSFNLSVNAKGVVLQYIVDCAFDLLIIFDGG